MGESLANGCQLRLGIDIQQIVRGKPQRLQAQPGMRNQLAGNIAQRQNLFNGANLDRGLGHAINNAGCLVLGKRTRTHRLERLHSQRPITAHAGENA